MHVLCYYIIDNYSLITIGSIFQTSDPAAVAQGQERMNELFKE